METFPLSFVSEVKSRMPVQVVFIFADLRINISCVGVIVFHGFPGLLPGDFCERWHPLWLPQKAWGQNSFFLGGALFRGLHSPGFGSR